MDKKEYEWVKKVREILLEQCKELSSEELNRNFDFGFQSIKESLFHMAGCYNAWLGSFVLSKNDKPLYASDEIKSMDIDDVAKYFAQADTYVEEILNKPVEEIHMPIERVVPWKSKKIIMAKTPYQLVTHSITHEFHHKGQIVTMIRLLGHTPKNTDILRL